MESINIVAAYFLDLIFGDPRWFPHPVRIMGKTVSFLEDKLRIGSNRIAVHAEGVILTVIVTGGSAFSAFLFLELLKRINPVLEIAGWIFLSYTCLAAKDLFLHAGNIFREIKGGNIEAARRRLSLIVGRDTKDFQEKKIVTAAVESVAESTNDGIIAPLFYLFLGGPVLAVAFKAVSTLDSMIGHKNEKYLYFGWCAAKLDDIANYIPARITGTLISFSALISGKDVLGAFRVMLRDGKKQDSPNSAVSEAAMAGALGIRLGGICSYQGRVVEHPYLGEEKNPVTSHLIKEAVLISAWTSLLMVMIGVIGRQAILYFRA